MKCDRVEKLRCPVPRFYVDRLPLSLPRRSYYLEVTVIRIDQGQYRYWLPSLMPVASRQVASGVSRIRLAVGKHTNS